MDSPLPNIIIADDHDLFRDALKTMLELNNVARVIAEAPNGKDLLGILTELNPDIILMDIEMPVMNGIEATKAITRTNPQQKILALSMFGEQQYYYKMIEAGASGFVLKTSNKSELTHAINTVHAGQNYFSNELLRNLVVKLGTDQFINKGGQSDEFTSRESQIVKLMCEGLSTQEIADHICLSVKTVENYRAKLLEKTKCKNSISLVVYAIKNHLVEI
jgi:DNA-binding NarL/FixJ family response regulator